jgi:hypothetical protein
VELGRGRWGFGMVLLPLLLGVRNRLEVVAVAVVVIVCGP